MSDALELGTPDDLHVHLRDGRALADTVRDVARVFGRALAMPNLAPPVASAEALAAYRARILAARPAGAAFEPLMALYLTDRVTPAVVRAARAAGAVAAKLYPAGATTNSDAGVTDLGALDATLAAMADERLLLLVHGEVTGADVDVFRSPDYLRRLNNPTPWSTKMQPAFRNFLRVACERLASAGAGDGGAMATIRLDLSQGGEPRLRDGAARLCAALLAVTGAGAAHVGLARSEVSGIRTRETDLRPGMSEEGFDAVVLVEGSGLPELEASVAALDTVIAESDLGLSRPRTIVYNLAWQLSSEQALG